MYLEESVVSRILYLDSVPRPALASCGPEIEHQAQQFLPSLIRRCQENVCQSLGNALIHNSVLVAKETCFKSPL
jgi:hypothetical protein